MRRSLLALVVITGIFNGCRTNEPSTRPNVYISDIKITNENSAKEAARQYLAILNVDLNEYKNEFAGQLNLSKDSAWMIVFSKGYDPNEAILRHGPVDNIVVIVNPRNGKITIQD